MANRLNIPEDLEQLIEKREQERRQQETASTENPQPNGNSTHATPERRNGKGRRDEDRQ